MSPPITAQHRVKLDIAFRCDHVQCRAQIDLLLYNVQFSSEAPASLVAAV